jgi:hypothetical protein
LASAQTNRNFGTFGFGSNLGFGRSLLFRFFFKYNNLELAEIINEEIKTDEEKLPLLEGKIQVRI